jgi:Ser/Thr protein kinase RdoA (MazF antagonist)
MERVSWQLMNASGETETRTLGRPIAEGRTAELYAWSEGEILKLFRDWLPAEDAALEERNSRLVADLGLPVPQVGERVEYEGRVGLVFERIDGPMMISAIARKPHWLLRYGGALGRLHAEIHSRAINGGLSSQHDRLEHKIRAARSLPEPLRDAALHALRALSRGTVLCHGDFHPGNVLLSRRGPVLIDWVDATAGHPLGDVARTIVLIRYGRLPSRALRRWWTRLRRSLFLRAYLHSYSRRNPLRRGDLRRWLPVVAAARLSEAIEGEDKRILPYLRAAL